VKNFARYFGLAVSKQSSLKDAAWDLILATAGDGDVEIEYLRKTGESPALKSVIAKVVNDPTLGVFSRQALTARSFYDPDGVATKSILNNAIRKSITGALEPARALQEAQENISNLSQ
jgi:maltose-binding protein MalE